MAPHVDYIRVSGSSVSPTTVKAHPNQNSDVPQNQTTFKVSPEFLAYNPSLSPASTVSSACDSGVESMGNQEHHVNVKYTTQQPSEPYDVNSVHMTEQYITYASSQPQPKFTPQYMVNGIQAMPQYYNGAPVLAVPTHYPVVTSQLNNALVPVGQPLSVDTQQHRTIPQMIPVNQISLPYQQSPVPKANSLDSSFSEVQAIQGQPIIPVVQQQIPQFVPHTATNTEPNGLVQQLPIIVQCSPGYQSMQPTQSPAPQTPIAQAVVESPNHGCAAPKSVLDGMPSPAILKTDASNVSVSRTILKHKFWEGLVARLDVNELEKVWESEFHKMFSQFPNPWSINPSLTIPPNIPCNADPNQPEMKTFMDSAKVRFICPSCNHCWTSMKGRVRFGYEIDNKTKAGLVVFRLYGQKCQKCHSPSWVHAMWYPEEIKKAIYNVCQKVGQSYYNWTKPVVRLDRRNGRPSKPHDTDSCQACSEGICREERNYV